MAIDPGGLPHTQGTPGGEGTLSRHMFHVLEAAPELGRGGWKGLWGWPNAAALGSFNHPRSPGSLAQAGINLRAGEEQTARGKILLCLQLAYNLEQISEPQLIWKMETPFLCCPIQQSHFMNYLPYNCSSHAYLVTFSLTLVPLSQT